MCLAEGSESFSEVYCSSMTVDKPVWCQECGQKIAKGDEVHTLTLQQSHVCLKCINKDFCNCGDPDYGKIKTHVCCDTCWKLWDAIRKVELSERGPLSIDSADRCGGLSLGNLVDGLLGVSKSKVRRYFRQLNKDHPEIRHTESFQLIYKPIAARG